MRKHFQALGRLKRGQMNRTEIAYAQYLELLKHAGEVLWYRFEGIKFRLADNTFLTPDFSVLTKDCKWEAHDVKPGRRDGTYYCTPDARMKMKVAAESFPLPFVIVWPLGNGWGREDV